MTLTSDTTIEVEVGDSAPVVVECELEQAGPPDLLTLVLTTNSTTPDPEETNPPRDPATCTWSFEGLLSQVPTDVSATVRQKNVTFLPVFHSDDCSICKIMYFEHQAEMCDRSTVSAYKNNSYFHTCARRRAATCFRQGSGASVHVC